MSESSSVRRALSLVREEISPTLDDKARLRTRIVAPALAAGAGARDVAAEGALGSNTATGAAPSGAAGASAGGAAAAASGAAASGAAASGAAATLTRWGALKAAGVLAGAAGLALLGVGGGVGFWLGREVAHDAAVVSAAPEGALPAREESPPAAGVSRAAASSGGVASASSLESPPPAASDSPRRDPSSLVEPGAAPRAEPAEAEPPGVEAPRAEAPPRAHGRRRAAPNPLNDELALLRRVERALRNNDPALARALLGELDQRFPDSRLGEERSAARRIADCRSRELGARDEARAFLRQHSASVYRQRIVLACGLDRELEQKSTASGSRATPMKNRDRADTHAR